MLSSIASSFARLANFCQDFQSRLENMHNTFVSILPPSGFMRNCRGRSVFRGVESLTQFVCCLGAVHFFVHPHLDPDEQDGRRPRGRVQPGGEGG